MFRWSRIGAVATVLLLAVVAWGTALHAWADCFTTWAEYDDQGYFMLAVRHVLDGHAPYDEFAFLHGPAFFTWRWLLHGVGPFPLTIDGVRVATVCTWTLVAALGAAFAGASAPRGTRLACALCVLAVSGAFFGSLANEPGHSQELVLLTGTLLCACLPLFARAQTEHIATALGVAAGVVVATKINVGALFVIGALVHFGARGAATPRGRMFNAGALLALLALPFVQLRSDFGDGWAVESAAANAFALAGLWLCARPDAPPATASTLGRFVLAACASYGASLVFVLTRGSSVTEVFRSTVLDPLRVPGIVHMFTGWAPGASLLALFTLALACALRAAPPHVRSRVTPWLAIAARVGLAFAWLRYTRMSTFAFVSYVPPLLPLALLPLRGESERTPAVWHVVACLATAGALQVYPVVGTQSAIAGFPCFLVTVVLLADLVHWTLNRAVQAERSALRARIAWAALVAASVALAVPAFDAGRRAFASWHASGWKLGLPGSTQLALKPVPTLRTRWLASNLEAHSSRFMAAWSTNAFYFWTTREPPTLDVITHAWQLVPDERQRAIITALEREPAPFVALRTGLDDELEQSGEPFVAWLRTEYRLLASYRGFELRVPRAAPAVELLDCAWAAEGALAAELPEPLYAEAAETSRRVFVLAVPPALRDAAVTAVRGSDPRQHAEPLGTDSGPPALRFRVYDSRGELLLGEGARMEPVRLGARVYVTCDRASVTRVTPPRDTLVFFGAGGNMPIAQLPIVDRPAR
jgi:hypothetical protein